MGEAVTHTACITRGTTTVSFDHDPEHQRYSQLSASGLTLYIGGGGVLAERFAGASTVQWTNYLFAAGQMVGVFVERSDETVATRYFHLDHLGSVSVISDENGIVAERLSYDAWGLRRHPDGTPDPASAITSQSTRGFTGHEHLAEVGLIHMNGRVYDPLLARFGTPDPMTENPFSTQGWNRYSYVGNSPVNFTDPSGYCFLGCFWKPIFKAIGNFLKKSWGAIVQVAAAVLCAPVGLSSVCAAIASAAVTGITSGNLGLAIKAGLISMVTSMAMQGIASAAGLNSGGGWGGNNFASTSGSDSWGPMMHLTDAGDAARKSIQIQFPLEVCAGNCGASSIAQSTVNAVVPGWHYSGLWSQAFSAGNYIKATGYFVATMADLAMFASPARAVTKGVTAVTGAPASSAMQGARLGQYLRQWETNGSQGLRELPNGRIRYYGDVAPADTAGEMVGRRLVREWDPATGATRTWHETLDTAGTIRQVRPQSGGTTRSQGADEGPDQLPGDVRDQGTAQGTG